ncbi:hypothetical protein HMPREF1983_01428 [Gemella bergeri ATCC 700627]|uniref:Prephenate dehydratase n=1 Tax=Gemella bergeri ATCC 700627 TaxID=1321820 RepID=U2QIB6_9BACL|nr:hypothetical protein [Gemella bergeri]ERK56241.1 hypothetical protein HMPREF1983_01428 [Gemella bergeri ATCC 700627]
MFENYSTADLFANIYKKKIINIIAVIVLFCAIAIPYTLKAINSKTTVKDTTNYSTYLSYKITSPLEEQQNSNKNKVGGYSDFYAKLLESNINGAFLFNDLSSEEMAKIANELDTGETTLKNSNFDYWDKKIIVNPLINNAGVSVKVLTSSKNANEIIEKKLDLLIDKFKDTYSDVKINKLDTINSQELVAGGKKSVAVNKTKLIMRLGILGILSIILVIIANIIVYIFNPTINRAGDYKKYNIGFVSTITTMDNLKKIIDYKINNQSLVFIGTNAKVLEKFKHEYKKYLSVDVKVRSVDDVQSLIEADNVLFIEEYGVTRYKNFEENLQVLANLDKDILGVINYKL